MALVLRNTLKKFPQVHLPPTGVPERRHNCNSCCTTQEKIPKGPAGGENVHCFSAVYNCFSNVQEKACYFLCFCVLASEVLLKAYNFASVQRKLSNEMCVRTYWIWGENACIFLCLVASLAQTQSGFSRQKFYPWMGEYTFWIIAFCLTWG